MLLPPDNYYEDRPVLHAAQGDFYAGVPAPVYVGTEPGKASGARKRPLAFLKPEPMSKGVFAPPQGLVVVCNYTCNFVAQPPGTPGYSHQLRQVAPVLPLIELIGNRGMQKTEARRLQASGFLSGLLWVPRPEGYEPDGPVKKSDEFTDDEYVVLLYAMSTVHQSALDEARRVARMTSQAQKRLMAGLIATVSPSLYDPDDLDDPDMSCSWSS